MGANGLEYFTTYSRSDKWYQLFDSKLLVNNGRVRVDGDGVVLCAKDHIRMIYDLATGVYKCPSCSASAVRILVDALG